MKQNTLSLNLILNFLVSFLVTSKSTARGTGRSIIRGGDIHIFMFTDCKNNLFQKKLIVQNPII